MIHNRAAAAFSAFLFAQGLLGFAALAAVILHDAPAHAAVVVALR